MAFHLYLKKLEHTLGNDTIAWFFGIFIFFYLIFIYFFHFSIVFAYGLFKAFFNVLILKLFNSCIMQLFIPFLISFNF